MDESTMFACWKALDKLELLEHKRLSEIANSGTDESLEQHKYVIVGIQGARLALDLLSLSELGKHAKECNHD